MQENLLLKENQIKQIEGQVNKLRLNPPISNLYRDLDKEN